MSKFSKRSVAASILTVSLLSSTAQAAAGTAQVWDVAIMSRGRWFAAKVPLATWFLSCDMREAFISRCEPQVNGWENK